MGSGDSPTDTSVPSAGPSQSRRRGDRSLLWTRQEAESQAPALCLGEQCAPARENETLVTAPGPAGVGVGGGQGHRGSRWEKVKSKGLVMGPVASKAARTLPRGRAALEARGGPVERSSGEYLMFLEAMQRSSRIPPSLLAAPPENRAYGQAGVSPGLWAPRPAPPPPRSRTDGACEARLSSFREQGAETGGCPAGPSPESGRGIVQF